MFFFNLLFRWANGPDSVKSTFPLLLKSTWKCLQVYRNSLLRPSSPWSAGSGSPSESTTMTRSGGRSSKSSDGAKRAPTPTHRPWSSGQLWPSCLWNQFQLWPLERTLRSGKWRPQSCLLWSICLLRDCTSPWLMWCCCRASIGTW